MTTIDVASMGIGREYMYDENTIYLNEGLLSKKVKSISFVDIKTITAKKGVFGWGDVVIVAETGKFKMEYVEDPIYVQQELTKIHAVIKKNTKRVDLM